MVLGAVISLGTDSCDSFSPAFKVSRPFLHLRWPCRSPPFPYCFGSGYQKWSQLHRNVTRGCTFASTNIRRLANPEPVSTEQLTFRLEQGAQLRAGLLLRGHWAVSGDIFVVTPEGSVGGTLVGRGQRCC